MALDKDMVHEYLWNRSNSKHLLRIKGEELAEELGCSLRTVFYILQYLRRGKKIRQVRVVETKVYVYQIYDPKSFDN